MTAAAIVELIRTARRRLFFCEAHQIHRKTPETCELCILEQMSQARGPGRRFRSIAQIMAR
jgi:hypothetical protein